MAGRCEPTTTRSAPASSADAENLGIDADAVSDQNVGTKFGTADAAEQGGKPVFEIRGDHLIAERGRFGLQDGLDLAHHGQHMQPGAEGARKLDGREQRLAAGGFVVEVNGDQNILVHLGPRYIRVC